jgi:hypothetical protein
VKVNIYETVEISDEQRVQLAVVLDEGKTKPKRQATRDEIKDFIWSEGASWATSLADQYNEALADAGTEPEPEDDNQNLIDEGKEPNEPEDEDLLGGSDDLDDEDLI